MMMSRNLKKFFAFSGLVKKSARLVVRRDEGHANLQVLDALAHVEVAPVDVLGLGMVLGAERLGFRRQRRLLLLRQRPLREECSDPEYRSPILFGRRHVLYVLLLRLLSFLFLRCRLGSTPSRHHRLRPA